MARPISGNLIINFEQLKKLDQTIRSISMEENTPATQRGKHLKLIARICNNSATILLDSGATGNFMDPNFQEKIGISRKTKGKTYADSRAKRKRDGNRSGNRIRTTSNDHAESHGKYKLRCDTIRRV